MGNRDLTVRGPWWSAVVVAAVAACQGGGTPRPVQIKPVDIRSPGEMPGDFQWRQTVAVKYADRDARSFDAALDKRGDTLRLVGLTPLGTVMFVAEAEGTAVRFENRTGEPLPFDGSHILLDVQRVFFPWLEGDIEDGVREGRRGEEQIRERWEGGRLLERVFERGSEEAVRVRYLEPGPRGQPAPRIELENPRYHYRLSIETRA